METKLHNQLVVIGDGIVYRNKQEYYVAGKARLDLYECFDGIDTVIIWSRIYDISEQETKKYSRYKIEKCSKKIKFCGISNQPSGARGYITTLVERYIKLNSILKTPSLIMCMPISFSEWVMWYCLRKRNLLFISRSIGDVECAKYSGKPFSNFMVMIGKYTIKKYLSECELQTWVSHALKEKYANIYRPSVVFHDCLIYQEQLVKEIHNRQENKFQLIFVGRLSKEKGISDLLKAMTLVKDLNIELTIVGSGGEEEKIKEFIHKNKLNRKVKLMGYIAWGTDLFSEMQRSDCLILPSYNEGLPMVILEGMSNGIPAIASNVGGIPEVIEDDINGLLFQAGDYRGLADRILCLYNDKEKYKKLCKNARRTAKENTREVQLEKFRKAYLEHVFCKL